MLIVTLLSTKKAAFVVWCFSMTCFVMILCIYVNVNVNIHMSYLVYDTECGWAARRIVWATGCTSLCSAMGCSLPHYNVQLYYRCRLSRAAEATVPNAKITCSCRAYRYHALCCLYTNSTVSSMWLSLLWSD